MVKNKKHKELIEVRKSLIEILNFSSFYHIKSDIRLTQFRLHEINKEIKKCIKEYNIKHSPTNISSIIRELKATKDKIEGKRTKFKYGIVNKADTNILIYTSDYDWLHDRKFNLIDNQLDKILYNSLNYEKVGCCYFGTLFSLTTENPNWSREISKYIEDKSKEVITLKLQRYNRDYSLIEFIENPIICSITLYFIRDLPIILLYNNSNEVLINKNIICKLDLVDYFKKFDINVNLLDIGIKD